MKSLTQCIKAGDSNGRPGWLIRFNYDRDLIEQLKTSVPHTEREWHPDSSEWWISEIYNDSLKGLFGNFEALAFLQGKMF